MIVKASDIEDTYRARGVLDEPYLPGAEDEEFPLVAPIEYDLTLRRLEERIYVQGPVHATIRLLCVRCVDGFDLSVQGYVDVELEPGSRIPLGEDLELKARDLDVEYYEGDMIDLSSLIHEEVLLNLPLNALCSEDCKGLCDKCGANRNHDECLCNRASGTLLGEKLKPFLVN